VIPKQRKLFCDKIYVFPFGASKSFQKNSIIKCSYLEVAPHPQKHWGKVFTQKLHSSAGKNLAIAFP
jgi:hypothetical protein